MFHSLANPLERLLSLIDDVLADPLEEAAPDPHLHPHRRSLRRPTRHRGGTVSRPPAHCVSPIRLPAPARRRDRVAH